MAVVYWLTTRSAATTLMAQTRAVPDGALFQPRSLRATYLYTDDHRCHVSPSLGGNLPARVYSADVRMSVHVQVQNHMRRSGDQLIHSHRRHRTTCMNLQAEVAAGGYRDRTGGSHAVAFGRNPPAHRTRGGRRGITLESCC